MDKSHNINRASREGHGWIVDEFWYEENSEREKLRPISIGGEGRTI